MLPFVRTGMTEEYADNPKVYGRWQPRMLETHEAAGAVIDLLSRPAEQLNLANLKLNVAGTSDDIELKWSTVKLEAVEQPLD